MALAGPHEQLTASVLSCPAVNVDETGWRRSGQQRTLWTASTPDAAVFRVAQDRHRDRLEELIGSDFAGIICSDRWWAYDHLDPSLRQACWAHLVRDFRRHAEGLAEQKAFGEHGLALCERLFSVWHAYCEHHDRHRLVREMAPIRRELRSLLKRAARKSKRTRWPALWTFVTVDGVEPTNNAAERALRGPVIQRKLSHGSRSEDGERFIERALSASVTCRLQGRSPVRLPRRPPRRPRPRPPAPRARLSTGTERLRLFVSVQSMRWGGRFLAKRIGPWNARDGQRFAGKRQLANLSARAALQQVNLTLFRRDTLIKRIQFTALLIAAGALLAIPAVGQAHHKTGHSKGGQGQGTGKSCAKKPTVNKGFTVRGTLVSYTADDVATLDGNETSVAITVTGANRHARVSGELTDTNATEPGVQVAGGSYTVSSSGTPADLFGVRLSGYETGETPAAGDKVRIVGKIAVTRKKCAAAGASLDVRYGAVNVRTVKIIDAD